MVYERGETLWECMSVFLNQFWLSALQMYYACSSGHGKSQLKHSIGGIKMPTETSKILWFEFDDGAEIWLIDEKLYVEEAKCVQSGKES